ncbi:MAG: hypothetical protein IJ193_09690 [Bacilli bacterium]|nr:hypothetical protein [Bacilli bacterium]
MNEMEQRTEQIPNEDYNFLRARMMRLEESYKQSVDQRVRKAVRDKTLYEICERFPNFFYDYADAFEACEMSSLMEITNLYNMVMGRYSVTPLPRIESEKQVKKLLKLKDKALKSFIRGYNEAVAHGDLTYYSQRIDDKLVFLTVENGEFVGAATDVSRKQRNGECLCHVCRRFRRGSDIIFVTNTAQTSKGDYSSIGQTFCSDYESCNKAVEDSKPLVKFLKYKLDKGEER